MPNDTALSVDSGLQELCASCFTFLDSQSCKFTLSWFQRLSSADSGYTFAGAHPMPRFPSLTTSVGRIVHRASNQEKLMSDSLWTLDAQNRSQVSRSCDRSARRAPYQPAISPTQTPRRNMDQRLQQLTMHPAHLPDSGARPGRSSS